MSTRFAQISQKRYCDLRDFMGQPLPLRDSRFPLCVRPLRALRYKSHAFTLFA